MKIIVCLFYTCFCIVSSQWLDPHDMNTGAKSKLKRNLGKSSITSDQEIINSNKVDSTIFQVHMRRIVSLLISSARIDKSDPELFHGHLMFTITPEDLGFLMDFKDNEVDLDMLRRLDTIFSESFSKSLVEDYTEKFSTLSAKLYFAIVNVHSLLLLGISFMLYIVYQLFRTNFSMAYILKYLLIIILIIDFGMRYKILIEEAEEHNLHIQYSSACDTNKMKWSEYFKSLFSNKGCKRRAVTPLDAFLHQLKNLIIIPLEALGTGMGNFSMEMYNTTPFGLGFILFPVMLIFSLFVFVFMMAFVMDKHIEFNLFHLCKLKFGSGGSQHSITGRAVEKLIDGIFHRPMVQEVRETGQLGSDAKETIKRKNKQKKQTKVNNAIQSKSETSTPSDTSQSQPKDDKTCDKKFLRENNKDVKNNENVDPQTNNNAGNTSSTKGD